MWQLTTTAINGTQLGPWALDVLLKATILIALAGLAATLLRRAPAATRHALWAASLLGTLLILFASAAPGWHILPLHSAPEARAPSSAAINLPPLRAGDIVAPHSAETLEPHRAAAPLPLLHQAPSTIPADLPPTPIITVPIPAAAVATPRTTSSSSTAPPNVAPRSIPWTSCLLLLWAAGIAALLAPLALALAALRQTQKTATPVQLNEAHNALKQLKATMGIRSPIQLLVSDACAVPMTFGILRPQIVVPTSSAAWPAARWRMVLTHELAHIRRRDIAIMLLGQLARAVYWFHPFAWIAYSQMAIESEKACDDAVLATGQEPHTYAAVLLEIAEGSRNRSFMKLAVLHMARRSTLETRVRGVLEKGPRRRHSNGWSAMTALAIVVLASAIGVLRAAGGGKPAAADPDPFKETDPATGKTHYVPYVVLGKTLSHQLGCMNCHSVDAKETIGTGPPWHGLYGREHEFSRADPTSFVADKTIGPADSEIRWDDYLKESILKPDAALVHYPAGPSGKDYHGMPSFASALSGSVTNAEMERALVTYIKSIGTTPWKPDVSPENDPKLYDADNPVLFDENKHPVHPESLAGIAARKASAAPATKAAADMLDFAQKEVAYLTDISNFSSHTPERHALALQWFRNEVHSQFLLNADETARKAAIAQYVKETGDVLRSIEKAKALDTEVTDTRFHMTKFAVAEAQGLRAGILPWADRLTLRPAVTTDDQKAAATAMASEALATLEALKALEDMRPRTPEYTNAIFDWNRRLLDAQLLLHASRDDRAKDVDAYGDAVVKYYKSLEAREAIDVTKASLSLGRYAWAEVHFFQATVNRPDGETGLLSPGQLKSAGEMLFEINEAIQDIIAIEDIRPNTPEFLQLKLDAYRRKLDVELLLATPDQRAGIIDAYRQTLDDLIKREESREGIDIDKRRAIAIHFARAEADYIAATIATPVAAPAPSPATTKPATQTAPAPRSSIIKLPGGGTVELVAISSGIQQNGSYGPWWTMDGLPEIVDWSVPGLDPSQAPSPGGNVDYLPRLFVFKIGALPEGASQPMAALTDSPLTRWPLAAKVLQRVDSRMEAKTDYYAAIGHYPADAATGTFTLGVAVEPWKTLAEMKPGDSGNNDGGEYSVGQPQTYARPQGGFGGGIRPGPGGGNMQPSLNGVLLKVAYNYPVDDLENRLTVVDDRGVEHAVDTYLSRSQTKDLHEDEAVFANLATAQVKLIRLQARHLTWIDFKDVALAPRSSRDDAPKPALPATKPAGITALQTVTPADDAEMAAALAIAKDRADDTTAVDAEKTIRDDKQQQYQRLQKSPGAVTQAELDAARMDVVVADARVKLAEHTHQQEILEYTLAKAQAAAGHPISGVNFVSDSRAITEASSDVEADAALAIAKDKADDTSMLTGGQAILDQKKEDLAGAQQKFNAGQATAQDLNAAKTEVTLAQSQADAAQHQHQQAILAYNLAKAQYDARKTAATQKH